MTGLLPIVEQLADAQTHSERADWLKRCSDSIVDRQHMAIRPILQTAGLIAGIAYLEARLAGCHAVRTSTGDLPQSVRLAIYVAMSDLDIAARNEGER